MTNKTMMQFFEWYLPNNQLHWKRAEAQAAELKRTGVNMVWLPPAYKGAAGPASVGYDVYDMYDLGEFDQKGAISTKYGTRADYLTAVSALQQAGIQVLCDIVLNHRMGADATEQVMVIDGLEHTPAFIGTPPISAERTGTRGPNGRASIGSTESPGTGRPTRKKEITTT